jgi:HK97 family phage portal protein
MGRPKHRKRPAKQSPEIRTSITDGFGEYTGTFSLPTLAGPSVTASTSLTIPAFWQAVSIYANTIASLDLYVAERDPRGGHTPAYDHPIYDLVHCQPNKITTSFRFRQAFMSHVLTHGNAYCEIERDQDGEPVQLHLLHPSNITPFLKDDGSVWYRFIREHIEVPARDILHFAGMGFDGLKGYSPVHVARNALGLAIAQENYQSSLMGNNAQPTGYLEVPEKMRDDQQSRLRDSWNKVHQGSDRNGQFAILSGGMKWVTTAFSPVDQMLIEQCDWSVAQIARLFNLPLFMLGEDPNAPKDEEEKMMAFSRSLLPWMKTVEQEMDFKLLTKEDRQDGFLVTHNMKSLLRANTAAQTTYNQSMFAMGALSINEIRLSEGDIPIDDPQADNHWIPTNNLTAIEEMNKVEPTTTEQEPTDEVDNIQGTALNGAQIASLLAIVSQVSQGLIPSESAKGLIEATFPTLTSQQIDNILGSIVAKPQEEPIQATQEPDPLPPGALNAMRDLVLDPVGRMIRREVLAARNASKKADFRDWVSNYYPKHRSLVIESILPAINAYNLTLGKTLDAEALATTLVETSRERLDGLAVCVPPEELPEAVERALDGWEALQLATVANLLGETIHRGWDTHKVGAKLASTRSMSR